MRREINSSVCDLAFNCKILLEGDNYKRLAQKFTNNLQIIYNRVNYELN